MSMYVKNNVRTHYSLITSNSVQIYINYSRRAQCACLLVLCNWKKKKNHHRISSIFKNIDIGNIFKYMVQKSWIFHHHWQKKKMCALFAHKTHIKTNQFASKINFIWFIKHMLTTLQNMTQQSILDKYQYMHYVTTPMYIKK